MPLGDDGCALLNQPPVHVTPNADVLAEYRQGLTKANVLAQATLHAYHRIGLGLSREADLRAFLNAVQAQCEYSQELVRERAWKGMIA